MKDPYFYDIPWELVEDDTGRVIGEIYTLGVETGCSLRSKSHQWVRSG